MTRTNPSPMKSRSESVPSQCDAAARESIERTEPAALRGRGIARAWSCAAVLGLGALASCFASGGRTEPALDYWRREDFFQAYHEIERVRIAYPDDPDIESLYQAIRRDYLLWQVRQSIYRDEEIEAIGLAERLQTLYPGMPEAIALQQKAERKLSMAALQEAQTHVIQGTLDQAFKSFQRSLAYDPANIEARKGLEEVDATYRRLREDAEQHHLSGIRQMAEGRLQQTAYQMRLAIEADAQFDPARRLGEETERRLAEEAYQKAIQTQESGYYDAAAVVFTSLKARYPNLPGLDDRLARAESESEARNLLERAQILTYKSEYDGARELLGQAKAKSESQLDKIALVYLDLTEREQESRYALARDEEIQGRLQDALTMFKDIESVWPGLLDVADRIIELGQRIEEAEKAYEAGVAAEKAGDLDEAIRQFGAVGLFWEEYEDANVRRAALIKLREEKKKAETSGGGETNGEG